MDKKNLEGKHFSEFTEVITRNIIPGNEKNYDDWLQHFMKSERQFPGYLGTTVIVPGGNIYIYSDGGLRFKQVPITVHLMGKQHVLGLIIDTVKTENHYASTHEMYGTLINGTGLDRIEKTLVSSPSQQQQKNNNKGMNMNGMTM